MASGGSVPATGPSSACGRDSCRSRRVIVLLIGIVALSLADLTVTTAHLLTTGMFEANPIAAWLIRSTESIWALSAFKLAMVSISVVLLYRLRRYAQGEIGAWLATIILALVCFQWHCYSSQVNNIDTLTLARSSAAAGHWVHLD